MSPRPTSKAREELWPDYKRMRDRIGAERGWSQMTRAEFDNEADRGSLYVGSPETVARRIATTAKALGLSRFDMKYSRRHAVARQDHALHRAVRPAK